MWTKKKKLLFVLYRITAKWLPISQRSSLSKKLSVFLAKKIIEKCGFGVNIERNAVFTPELKLGNYSGIGVNCEVYGPVTVGDNVMMGPEVVIYTRNHNIERTDIPMQEQGYAEVRPVVIGNDVWIGNGAKVLQGVTVGDGAVIGAGAIVTKDVPPYAIVGGNPAHIIRYRFPQDIIGRLLKIKWWQYGAKVLIGLDIVNPTHEMLDELEERIQSGRYPKMNTKWYRLQK